MRVFKNKWFTRWARGEDIQDATLLNIAAEVVAGWVEANLGGCLFKKRIARTGEGKSGGYRTLVGYKSPNTERIIFLYAFAKNVRDNISVKEEAALGLTAEAFILTTDKQLNELLAEGSIWEIQHHE
jgi:hypothetical protein